jgi:hypothetical protein
MHYPNSRGKDDGLLRLHSTFRHDLKIYTSDEGRVQVSVAHSLLVLQHTLMDEGRVQVGGVAHSLQLPATHCNTLQHTPHGLPTDSPRTPHGLPAD